MVIVLSLRELDMKCVLQPLILTISCLIYGSKYNSKSWKLILNLKLIGKMYFILNQNFFFFTHLCEIHFIFVIDNDPNNNLHIYSFN